MFCGGWGMRMRDGGHDNNPKPMQMVGPRPLAWHAMRYYAHSGHEDFILCLGRLSATTTTGCGSPPTPSRRGPNSTQTNQRGERPWMAWQHGGAQTTVDASVETR